MRTEKRRIQPITIREIDVMILLMKAISGSGSGSGATDGGEERRRVSSVASNCSGFLE